MNDAINAAELASRPAWRWFRGKLEGERKQLERRLVDCSRDGRLDEIEAAFVKGRIFQIDRVDEQVDGLVGSYQRWQNHIAQKNQRQNQER